jgi:acyl carrier protein
MREEQIIEALKEYLVPKLPKNQSEVVLTPDLPLIQAGLIDSLELFKLINFIEKQFEIKIGPNEIVLSNFETLAAIQKLVESKLGG